MESVEILSDNTDDVITLCIGCLLSFSGFVVTFKWLRSRHVAGIREAKSCRKIVSRVTYTETEDDSSDGESSSDAGDLVYRGTERSVFEQVVELMKTHPRELIVAMEQQVEEGKRGKARAQRELIDLLEEIKASKLFTNEKWAYLVKTYDPRSRPQSPKWEVPYMPPPLGTREVPASVIGRSLTREEPAPRYKLRPPKWVLNSVTDDENSDASYLETINEEEEGEESFYESLESWSGAEEEEGKDSSLRSQEDASVGRPGSRVETERPTDRSPPVHDANRRSKPPSINRCIGRTHNLTDLLATMKHRLLNYSSLASGSRDVGPEHTVGSDLSPSRSHARFDPDICQVQTARRRSVPDICNVRTERRDTIPTRSDAAHGSDVLSTSGLCLSVSPVIRRIQQEAKAEIMNQYNDMRGRLDTVIPESRLRSTPDTYLSRRESIRDRITDSWGTPDDFAGTSHLGGPGTNRAQTEKQANVSHRSVENVRSPDISSGRSRTLARSDVRRVRSDSPTYGPCCSDVTLRSCDTSSGRLHTLATPDERRVCNTSTAYGPSRSATTLRCCDISSGRSQTLATPDERRVRNHSAAYGPSRSDVTCQSCDNSSGSSRSLVDHDVRRVCSDTRIRVQNRPRDDGQPGSSEVVRQLFGDGIPAEGLPDSRINSPPKRSIRFSSPLVTAQIPEKS